MTEHTWQYGDLSIYYRLHGEGPLLVLLHGWGANAGLFAGVETFAGKCYTVASPDLPGFGKSAEPAEAYDLDDYVTFVTHFVRHVLSAHPQAASGEAARPVILLGHSHGGRTLLRLLARMAELTPEETKERFGFTVPKAVLVDSAGLVAKKTPEQERRARRYRTMKNLLVKSGLTKLFPGALPALQKRFGSADYAAASPVMRQSMVKVVNTDLREEMTKIRIPVLLIWGDQDTATPLADGQEMERRIPEAGLAVVPGAGHYSFLDRPGHFHAILGSFLGVS